MAAAGGGATNMCQPAAVAATPRLSATMSSLKLPQMKSSSSTQRIHEAEIEALLRELSEYMAEIEEYLDERGDKLCNRLELEQFKSMLLHFGWSDSETVPALFHFLDKDGSGYISYIELATQLRSLCNVTRRIKHSIADLVSRVATRCHATDICRIYGLDSCAVW